jgi:Uma2 family endonuclease
MPATTAPSKAFTPGTTGWAASDLDDPRIEAKWMRGSYEIVDGVLTTMPPAYFAGGKALFNLMIAVREHQTRQGVKGDFSIEVDIVVDEERVAKADAVWMTPTEQKRQAQASHRAGKPDPERARILVPPSLIIESVSPGHEAHDRKTKRRWYAEFGVPHYWLLDGYARTLECLSLERGRYRVDASGKQAQLIRPRMMSGLAIRLASVWGR